MNLSETPLEIEVKNGQVIISIGVETLCFATQAEIHDFKITNKEGFVKDLINELNAEEEDGTTLVHRMFDKAADNAIENGSENVLENGEEE